MQHENKKRKFEREIKANLDAESNKTIYRQLNNSKITQIEYNIFVHITE